MLTNSISTVLLKAEKLHGPKLTYSIYLSSKMEYCKEIFISLNVRNKRAFQSEPFPGLTHYKTQLYKYNITLF